MSNSSHDPQPAPDSDELTVAVHGGVATVTLHRPERRNAITPGMFIELERYLLEAARDGAVRVVVLTGAGGTFSAGADLMPQDRDARRRAERACFPGDLGGDILDRGNRCILGLQRLRKPVLASIGGDALGIGCSLALAADLRIASRSARLRLAFARVGLGPDGGASRLLTRHVGTAKALELLMLADWIDAEDAQRLGLLNRVVDTEALTATTMQLATRLAAGPTLAYGAAKTAVYEGASLSLEAAMDLEARMQRIVGKSRDAEEGVRAFREKREPEFRGH